MKVKRRRVESKILRYISKLPTTPLQFLFLYKDVSYQSILIHEQKVTTFRLWFTQLEESLIFDVFSFPII